MSELAVLINDQVAGLITRHDNGALSFRYAEDYREQPSPTPLSLSLPPVVGNHRDERRRRPIENYLEGLLPEDPDVRKRWAEHYGVRANAFDLLGTPIGEDCAGAAAFMPPERVDQYRSRRGSIRWLTEGEAAARIMDLETDETSWSGNDFAGRFSLAGAQAKTALLLRGDRWGLPSGPVPTTHIVKPGARRFAEHALNEHLCLDAARRVGILASRTRVHLFGNQPAVIVERFDRVTKGTRITRRHQEDLIQALGLPSRMKYQNEGGPSPRSITALFDKVMSKEAAEESRLGFLDGLAWNWIVGGTDGHAKNYSVLLQGRAIRLAPLYDISSALPYISHERRAKLAMKIGGSYELYVGGRNLWPAAAKELGLDESTVLSRVKDLAVRAPAAFASAASAPEVVALDGGLAVKLSSLIADRASRCADVL